MFPGSTLPPGTKPPRRRRTKTGKRRKGPTSVERIMRAAGIKAGIIAKPPKRFEDIGRCLSHACDDPDIGPYLGFPGAPWSLALYLFELFLRRKNARKKNAKVRLPPEKTPPNIGIFGVACRHCAGRGCHRCEQYGYGLVLRCSITKRASRCERHEAAPEPSPASATSAPAVSAAPTGRSWRPPTR